MPKDVKARGVRRADERWQGRKDRVGSGSCMSVGHVIPTPYVRPLFQACSEGQEANADVTQHAPREAGCWVQLQLSASPSQALKLTSPQSETLPVSQHKISIAGTWTRNAHHFTVQSKDVTRAGSGREHSTMLLKELSEERDKKCSSSIASIILPWSLYRCIPVASFWCRVPSYFGFERDAAFSPPGTLLVPFWPYLPVLILAPVPLRPKSVEQI